MILERGIFGGLSHAPADPAETGMNTCGFVLMLLLSLNALPCHSKSGALAEHAKTTMNKLPACTLRNLSPFQQRGVEMWHCHVASRARTGFALTVVLCEQGQT